MAEDVNAEETAKKPKSKKTMILIIVLVILGLALAAGISYFVTTKLVKKSHLPPVIQKGPGVYIKVGDAKDGTIIVNVGGVQSNHYLKIGLVLEMNSDDKTNFKDGKLTEAAKAKILDAIMLTLRSESMKDYEANNEEKLKQSLVDSANKALGVASVYNVYITSFILE